MWLSRQFRRCSFQNNNTSATFLLRFFLLHAALKSHLFKWEYPSEIHTREKKTTFWAFKLPSGKLNARNQPGVPELATELNAVPSTKADGHPIWRWSFLPDWSGAQRAQLSPTRYTHTHTHIHALTHTLGGATSLEREVLCQWVPVMDNCISIFTQRHFIRMCVGERESLSAIRHGGEKRKNVKRFVGNLNKINRRFVDMRASLLALCHANCQW